LGLANLLPLGPVDGVRMFKVAMNKYFGEKKGNQVWMKVSYLFFLIILMFGPNSPIDIYKPLWSINAFTRAILKPDKYFLPYIIFLIALISGQSFSLIERFKGNKKYVYTGILCLLAAFSIYDIFKVRHSIISKVSYATARSIQRKSDNNFFQVKFYKPPDEIHHLNIRKNDDFWFYPLLRQNIGIVNFYPTVSIASSAIPKYFIDEQKSEIVFKHMNNFFDIEHLFKVNPEYKGEAFFLQRENKANSCY